MTCFLNAVNPIAQISKSLLKFLVEKYKNLFTDTLRKLKVTISDFIC